MNVAQIDIALRMIRERKFSINGHSSKEEWEAAAFVFDNGVLMRGHAYADEVAKILEERRQALLAHG